MLLVGLEWQKQRRERRSREASAGADIGPAARFALPPEDVGWVFGRLIGVPGAEKPLSGGNVFSNQQLAPPATRTR